MKVKFLLSFIVIFFLKPLVGEAYQFKVLTYNTWLLSQVADDYAARLQALPIELFATQADIIALQEVWGDDRRIELTQNMRYLGYPYALFAERPDNYLRGRIGNGLIVFSKFPILGPAHLLSFSVFTRPEEWLSRKGAIHMQVQVPHLGRVDFYNSHLGAVSFNPTLQAYDPSNMNSLVSQAVELTQFMRQTAQNNVQLLTIDANTHFASWNSQGRRFDLTTPSPVYSHFVTAAHLVDTFHVLHDPQRENIITYDQEHNINVTHGHMTQQPSEYLDYIFMSQRSNTLRVLRSEIMFTRPLLSTGAPLSDHYGVMTTFETVETL